MWWIIVAFSSLTMNKNNLGISGKILLSLMFKDDESLGLRTQKSERQLRIFPRWFSYCLRLGAIWFDVFQGTIWTCDFIHVTQKILGTRFIALIWTSTIISQPQKSIPFLFDPFSYWDIEIWGMVMLGAWSLMHNEWRLKEISLWNWHI